MPDELNTTDKDRLDWLASKDVEVTLSLEHWFGWMAGSPVATVRRTIDAMMAREKMCVTERSCAKTTKFRAPRPTGYELRLVNAAVDLVDLGISLSDSARERLLELRRACETYVGPEMRKIPLKVLYAGR